MQLSLAGIRKRVGAEIWLHDTKLTLQPGAVTVLLGATQAGKTSLMRIMAGLDQPTRGSVQVDGVDVTGVPVRERNVSMVYQQFINYPSMKVAANIASPLKLRGESDIDRKVRDLAAKLHIEMFLDRYPAELSGGQQQRVALARALAKGAPLMLLDEPLVNLDYKLREELREELTQLFASRRHDGRLCHHRTRRGAAAGRLHGGARRGRVAAVRADVRGLPLTGIAARGARLQRPADEPDRGRGDADGVQIARRRGAGAGAAGWHGGPGDRRRARRAHCMSRSGRTTSRCPGASSWPRSRARTPSCTSTPRSANWWRS